MPILRKVIIILIGVVLIVFVLNYTYAPQDLSHNTANAEIQKNAQCHQLAEINVDATYEQYKADHPATTRQQALDALETLCVKNWKWE